MNTPIVLIIFKRSQSVKKIIDILRIFKPTNIYVIADGPREINEKSDCKKAREEIDKIDWNCSISKNYSLKNLGLKKRFKSGLDWVFENESKAVILEDDCIPDPSFFKYCDELLTKYKNNKKILTISGNNFNFTEESELKNSYFFSKYPLIWGWATWKRTWDLYDEDISDWNINKTKWLDKIYKSKTIKKYWKLIFNKLSKEEINTWDYQLTYLSLKENGLNIIPSINLVKNIGVDSKSTNINKKSRNTNLRANKIKFPLNHPKKISTQENIESKIEERCYLNSRIKVSLFIKSILGII